MVHIPVNINCKNILDILYFYVLGLFWLSTFPNQRILHHIIRAALEYPYKGNSHTGHAMNNLNRPIMLKLYVFTLMEMLVT